MAWDRYSYVYNNPINAIDPTGHAMDVPDDGGLAPSGYDYIDYRNAISNNPVPYFFTLPISKSSLTGVQWFGASQRAYDLKSWDEDIYQYCQYLHCGLDLLANYGTPVVSSTWGRVKSVYGPSANNEIAHEGPYAIVVEYGQYTIKYGHSDGTILVEPGEIVRPGTPLTGVGNMGGAEESTEIDHIHLEVRGPGNWGGKSQNPLKFMSGYLVEDLVDVSLSQTNEVEMGRYWISSSPPGTPKFGPVSSETDLLFPGEITRYGPPPPDVAPVNFWQ